MNSFSPPVRSAPSRQLIVADPSKMTFFAQANTARFATHATAGSLSGFSAGEVPAADNTVLNIASGAGAFFRQLIGGQQAPPTYAPPLPVVAPASDNTFLGLPLGLAIGIGVAGVAFVGYKFLKK